MYHLLSVLPLLAFSLNLSTSLLSLSSCSSSRRFSASSLCRFSASLAFLDLRTLEFIPTVSEDDAPFDLGMASYSPVLGYISRHSCELREPLRDAPVCRGSLPLS